MNPEADEIRYEDLEASADFWDQLHKEQTRQSNLNQQGEHHEHTNIRKKTDAR